MIRMTCLAGALALAATSAQANPPDNDLGLAGVSFDQDDRTEARKAMDEQAQRPARGGELSSTIYIKTQERLAKSFEQPIPDKIGESTSE